MISRRLSRNERYRAMTTPVSPLLTRLIHTSPSYWTIYCSFETILNMEAVHWIGPQIQCSTPGVPKLGYVYPWWYICLSEGVHFRLAI